MATSALADQVQQLEPVLITAPTARNGITLLQRLLNSSGRIVVFGENTTYVEALPELVYLHVGVARTHAAELAAAKQRFMAGDTEGWTSNLWPDPGALAHLSLEWFYSATIVNEQSARAMGRPRWGVKNPMTRTDMVDRFLTLLKRVKVLFIYRDLFDVARSAKARQFVRTPQDMERLARQWQTNVTHVLDHPNDRVLVIRHEDLTTQPDAIDRIEGFTGVTGIDRSVLGRRINTFEGSPERGMSPTGYIEPSPLTPEETAILQRVAAVGLVRTGYAAAA